MTSLYIQLESNLISNTFLPTSCLESHPSTPSVKMANLMIDESLSMARAEAEAEEVKADEVVEVDRNWIR